MGIYNGYKKVMNGFCFIEKVILVVVLAVVTAVTFGNVLSRFILPTQWSFTEELVINIFVLMAMLGAAVCARDEGALVSMALFSGVLPRKGQRVLNIICAMIGLIFAYVMIKYGYERVLTLIANGKKTDVLRIDSWKFYLAIPVGGACMALHLIEFAIDNVFHIITGEPVKNGEVEA